MLPLRLHIIVKDRDERFKGLSLSPVLFRNMRPPEKTQNIEFAYLLEYIYQPCIRSTLDFLLSLLISHATNWLCIGHTVASRPASPYDEAHGYASSGLSRAA